jgi:hypothetical protein
MSLFLGKGIETSDSVYIETDRSRSVLICGKRGSGKSYTMGNIIEDLVEDQKQLVVVIDPMGIFHTMVLPNSEQARHLREWGFNPRGYSVKLLVAGDPLSNYAFGEQRILKLMEERGVKFEGLKINPSDLSADAWCDFFDLDINQPTGIALFRAIQNLSRKKGKLFFLKDIISSIEMDGQTPDRTKDALLNRLSWADSLNIFSTAYYEMLEMFEPTCINVVDLHALDPGRFNLRNLVVCVVAQRIFRERTKARAMEELGIPTSIPRTWLAIDEAHQFAPATRSTLAKEWLIRYVKEGRQPGVSLIASTQQPSALDPEILSQCDLILCHKVTTTQDMNSVNNLSADYMNQELRAYIHRLGRIGEAVMVDDDKEQVQMLAIRPRRSRHGGGEK